MEKIFKNSIEVKLEQYFSKLKSILQFSNFHRYRIFLNFAIIHFESFSDTKKIGRHFAIPREGIEECRGPLFAYKEEGRKTYSNPLLPLTLCKYKRNLLQINEKIYIPPVEYILVEGFYQEEYFDSTLKQTCVYIRVCKYHALFYHPPPSLPTGQRKNSPSVFTFIQVNIHVCSLYVIRSLDI